MQNSLSFCQLSFSSQENMLLTSHDGATVIAEEPQEGDEPNIESCVICTDFLSGRTVSFCSQGHNMHAEPCARELVRNSFLGLWRDQPQEVARVLEERRFLVIPGNCATCRESFNISARIDEQYARNDTTCCVDMNSCLRRCCVMTMVGCPIVASVTIGLTCSFMPTLEAVRVSLIVAGGPALFTTALSASYWLSRFSDEDACCVGWRGCRLRASPVQNSYEEITSDTGGRSDFTDTSDSSESTPMVTQPQSSYGAFNVAYHNLLHPETGPEEPTAIVYAPRPPV